MVTLLTYTEWKESSFSGCYGGSEPRLPRVIVVEVLPGDPMENMVHEIKNLHKPDTGKENRGGCTSRKVRARLVPVMRMCFTSYVTFLACDHIHHAKDYEFWR